ncbi:hypothetical protein HK096_006030, partial [Nowakowskiella sp. JEL0078]
MDKLLHHSEISVMLKLAPNDTQIPCHDIIKGRLNTKKFRTSRRRFSNYLSELNGRDVNITRFCDNPKKYMKEWTYAILALNNDGKPEVRNYNYLGEEAAQSNEPSFAPPLTDPNNSTDIQFRNPSNSKLHKRATCVINPYVFSSSQTETSYGYYGDWFDDGNAPSVWWSSWMSRWTDGVTSNTLVGGFRSDSPGCYIDLSTTAVNDYGYPSWQAGLQCLWSADWFWFAAYAQRGWSTYK